MNQLDFSQPPFDVLTLAERQSLKKHSQIRYLKPEERLQDEALSFFYVVLKGSVQQSLNEVFVSAFHADNHSNDWFDARKQVNTLSQDSNSEAYNYISTDETLLLQIDGSAIDRVASQNHLIRQLLFSDLNERMQAYGSRKNDQVNLPLNMSGNQAEAQQLMLQPVTSISLLPTHYIDETDTLTTAAKVMTQAGLKHVLVRSMKTQARHPTRANENNVGILTDKDICRAISEGVNPKSIACKAYTNFKLRTVHDYQDLSDALILMMRYRTHRLPVVSDDGNIIGVLGQSDLLAYLSHHSQLITVHIEQASCISELQHPVDLIGKYIRRQHHNGVKVGVISRIVQTLNAQVFSKLWRLIVPEIVYENTCVVVMGSEGRGEQIMRTDQDNALIIRNGFKHPDLAQFAQTFNESLAEMGYPLCDGHIMMNNPMWCQSLSRMTAQVTSWFALKQPEHGIWLSAVLDAAYVCGDEKLLTSLRAQLIIANKNADAMKIRQFARAALQFGEVNLWLQKFVPFRHKSSRHTQDIDLKKAGIFPLVHGIRCMAMEQNIFHVTSTTARLNALARKGVITQKRADELIETLEFFMAQRLAVALSTDDKCARQVNPRKLSALERDLLKQCLSVVKSFKSGLEARYQLSYA